jgi:arylsulfatase A
MLTPPRYANPGQEYNGSTGAWSSSVDAVDAARLADDTLVLFVSDNGGLEHEQSGRIVTSNKPLRGEKGTLYEGGIRIPAIARRPHHIPAASICTVPGNTIDVYPILHELSGANPADGQTLDGVSLARLLTDPTTSLDHDTLYWHLPHYHHETPAGAIRRGVWKLIEFSETGRCELYDLGRDLSERNDLAAAEPSRVADLQ